MACILYAYVTRPRKYTASHTFIFWHENTMSIIKYSAYDAPFCLHSENRISLLHNTEHSYTDSARRPLSRLHIYNLLLCPLYKLIKSNIIHVKCVIIFRESYYKDRSITLEIFNLMFFTSMSCLTCEREKRRSTRNIDDGDDEERRKKKIRRRWNS